MLRADFAPTPKSRSRETTNLMISNVEEVLLLLKKWKTESSRVIALIGRRSMIVRLEGAVGLVTENSFSIVSGESFIYVLLSGCAVNYAGTAELEEMMKDHLPKNWESSIRVILRPVA
jgi:hypothetical protein